jgi:hypothetical protein
MKDKSQKETSEAASGTSIWNTFYVKTIRIVLRGVKWWGPATRFSLKLD